MNIEILDLSNREEVTPVQQHKDYQGMLNFSQEQMPGLLQYTSVLNPAFNISYEGNKKILDLNFGIDSAHLEYLDDISKWFGYSQYDLHRMEDGTFQVTMKAEKPVEDIYYDDIRVAYLNKDASATKENSVVYKEPAGPSYSPAPVLPPSQRKIATKKKTEIQNLVKEEQPKQEKIQVSTSNETKEAKKEQPRESLDESKERSKENNVEEEKYALPDIDLTKIHVLGYHASTQWKENTQTLYVYYQSQQGEELNINFSQEITKGKFQLFVPQNSLGQFILLRSDGTQYKYPESLQGGAWNTVVIDENIPISALIYRAPQEIEEETVLSLRGSFHEE